MGTDLFFTLLPKVLVAAVTVTLITAIGALITAATADSISGGRHSAAGELIGLGAGNAVGALFGGIPSGGSPSRVLANYSAGGRTRLSHIVASALILVSILGLGQLIGYLPLAAVAGALVVMAVGFFDTWAIAILRKAFHSKEKYMFCLLTK